MFHLKEIEKKIIFALTQYWQIGEKRKNSDFFIPDKLNKKKIKIIEFKPLEQGWVTRKEIAQFIFPTKNGFESRLSKYIKPLIEKKLVQETRIRYKDNHYREKTMIVNRINPLRLDIFFDITNLIFELAGNKTTEDIKDIGQDISLMINSYWQLVELERERMNVEEYKLNPTDNNEKWKSKQELEKEIKKLNKGKSWEVKIANEYYMSRTERLIKDYFKLQETIKTTNFETINSTLSKLSKK